MITEARRACRESLEIALQLDNEQSIAMALECAADVAQATGQYPAAAKFLGAASAIRESHSIIPIQIERADNHRIHELLVAALGDAQVQLELLTGASLSPRKAASLALASI